VSDEAILFIDDDQAGREVALFNLRKAGYQVEGAESGDEGLARFDPEHHALVITDVRMPGTSGMDVLKAVRNRAPEVPVVVITAYGNVELAVEAMKAGAVDFIGKPFNRDHLLLAVEKALEGRRLRREVKDLRIRSSGVGRTIISASAPMQTVLDLADRVAASDATTLLITGESGTGKELVARRVHVRSKRAEGPFVAVNCAAVPGELLESELFGHAKGAFTGAHASRLGRFRQAAGGTLFLDEIGELPLPLQGKLLRVLQERVVDPVGSDSQTAVDVRVVAASNQELTRKVETGELREDLLYRLNVVEINLPPLRERRDDIEPLIRHFVAQLSQGRELGVPDSLIAALQARPWPGNVRELANICERLVIFCRGDSLSLDDLPPSPAVTTSAVETGGLESWPPLPEAGISLFDLEKQVIERVLALKAGNVSRAAAFLRVPRHILAYRMEKYGIRRPGK